MTTRECIFDPTIPVILLNKDDEGYDALDSQAGCLAKVTLPDQTIEYVIILNNEWRETWGVTLGLHYFVEAHEYAHYYLQHTTGSKEEELEADVFALLLNPDYFGLEQTIQERQNTTYEEIVRVREAIYPKFEEFKSALRRDRS